MVRPILCVVGESGSGKTTLLEGLIGALAGAGLKVGAVKHAATGPGVESPGKDSARLADAGARPAVVSGPEGVIAERLAAEIPLLDLAETFCAACDLVLVEGYKGSPHDKILVAPAGRPAWASEIRSVRLIVSSDGGGADGALRRDDTASIAAWVLSWLKRRRRLGAGVAGAILVGGQGRRMGADKALLRRRGRSVLADLAELLGGRVEAVWAIGRQGAPEHAAAPDLPRCLRWCPDVHPGRGPLGGIATALRLAGQGRAVLVVACDMPAFGGEAADLLLQERRPDRAASALRGPASGRPEPLAAVYEPAALEPIEQAIASGRLRATDMLETLHPHVIEVPPPLAGQLVNLNTPADLEGLER